MPSDEHDHVDEIIAAWAQAAPELDLGTVAVIGRILRAARHLSREIELQLGTLGLGIHECNALAALRRQGEPYELTPTALSDALLFTSGGLTKLIERLEAAGHVVRTPDATDGRVVQVRLTESGRELIDEAMKAHLENQARLLQALDQEEREALAGALRRLLVDLEPGAARRTARAARG